MQVSNSIQSSLLDQLMHDLHSPLMALRRMAIGSDQFNSRERRLVKLLSARIEAITAGIVDPDRFDWRRQEILPIAKLVRDLVREKEVEFSADSKIHLKINAAAMLSFVKLNRQKFNCIFSNLLNNAFESYSNLDSEISRKIFVELKSSKNFVYIDIEDQGIGIARARLNHIFEPGYSFRKKNGCGLGLNQSRECIENWGGNLRIFSHFGEGTRVRILLPKLKF